MFFHSLVKLYHLFPFFCTFSIRLPSHPISLSFFLSLFLSLYLFRSHSVRFCCAVIMVWSLCWCSVYVFRFCRCVDPQIPRYAVCMCVLYRSIYACVRVFVVHSIDEAFLRNVFGLNSHSLELTANHFKSTLFFVFVSSFRPGIYISHINLYHRNREALQRIVDEWHNKIG